MELHDWVTKKMEETKVSTPWAKVTFSSVVEHALVELRNAEEQGKAASPEPAIAPIYRPEDHSATGSSTRMKKNSRRTG